MPPTITGGRDDSDSDVPLVAAKLSKEKAEIMKAQDRTAKKLEAEDKKTAAAAAKKRKPAVKKEEESDSDAPLTARNHRPAAAAKTKAKANGIKKEDLSDDDEPLAKRPRAKAPVVKKEPVKKEPTVKKEPVVKKEPAVKKEPKGKGRAKKSETPATQAEADDEDEESEFKWWENPDTIGTVKWKTLEHNGVLFPPPYEPLPKNVKMKYNGVEIALSAGAEEVAGFFAAMMDSDHARNPKFVENFFKDFQQVIKESGGAKDPQGNVREIPVPVYFFIFISFPRNLKS